MPSISSPAMPARISLATVHAATFGASANGVSFRTLCEQCGRRGFRRDELAHAGFDQLPSARRPSGAFEIMFQPPLLGTNENYDAEFIELANITATNVPLYDVAFPTNTGACAMPWTSTSRQMPACPGTVACWWWDSIPRRTHQDRGLPHQLRRQQCGADLWAVVRSSQQRGRSHQVKLPDPPQQLDGFVPYVQVEKSVIARKPRGRPGRRGRDNLCNAPPCWPTAMTSRTGSLQQPPPAVWPRKPRCRTWTVTACPISGKCSTPPIRLAPTAILT